MKNDAAKSKNVALLLERNRHSAVENISRRISIIMCMYVYGYEYTWYVYLSERAFDKLILREEGFVKGAGVIGEIHRRRCRVYIFPFVGVK